MGLRASNTNVLIGKMSGYVENLFNSACSDQTTMSVSFSNFIAKSDTGGEVQISSLGLNG
jgi:hypothetical protein